MIRLRTLRPVCFRLLISILTIAMGLNGTVLSLNAQGHTPGPCLVGMSIHPDNPFLFDFIVDEGFNHQGSREFKFKSENLIKYFLTSLTIPDKDAWVNLSPFEKDRIIPQALGQTAMGQVMLEQDYQLKQLTAALTNPNIALGQFYWQQVQANFGHGDLKETISKVWIVPDGAEIFVKDDLAYITASHLKVMMPQKERLTRSEMIFSELILPQLNKAVNESPEFAPIRQVYQSVILAVWYKRTLKESLLGKTYADRSKMRGIDIADQSYKEKIYEQYLAVYKRGSYDLIQEFEDDDGNLTAQKYFAGGISDFQNITWAISSLDKVRRDVQGRAERLRVVSSILNQTVASSPDRSEGFNLPRINFVYSRVSGVIEAIRLAKFSQIEELLLQQNPNSPRVKQFIQILKEEVSQQIDLTYENPGYAMAEHYTAIQNLLADDRIYSQYSDLYDQVITIFPKSSQFRQAHLQIQGDLVLEALAALPENWKAAFLRYAELKEDSLVKMAYETINPSFGKLIDELVEYTDGYYDQASSGILSRPLVFLIQRVVDAFDINSRRNLERIYRRYMGFDRVGNSVISTLSGMSWEDKSELIRMIQNESFSDPKLLSVGMGNGTFEQALVQSGFQVVGLDIFKEFADAAKAEGIPSVVYKGRRFPFASQSFSVVLFPESLEHMKYKDALLEAHRVLKDDGKAIILTAKKDYRHMYDIEIQEEDVFREFPKYGFGDIRIQERTTQTLIGPVQYKMIVARKTGSQRPASSSRVDTKGGIDLNSSTVDLKIKQDLSGNHLPTQPQDGSQIQIDGLTPIIFNIQPFNLNSFPTLSMIKNAPADQLSWR